MWKTSDPTTISMIPDSEKLQIISEILASYAFAYFGASSLSMMSKRIQMPRAVRYGDRNTKSCKEIRTAKIKTKK